MFDFPMFSRHASSIRCHSFNLSWLIEGSEPVMPRFTSPSLFSGLLTYSLGNGEISTHHLDLLCDHNRVLIVGTDRAKEFYPRQSLANSIDSFLAGVLTQFPWVSDIHWDLLERNANGECFAVAIGEEVDRKGHRIRFCHPQRMWIDDTPIRHLLGAPSSAQPSRFKLPSTGVHAHDMLVSQSL